MLRICRPYRAWRGGLQTCCYKYAALTGLSQSFPKSVIISKNFIFAFCENKIFALRINS
ncbi:Uncharacterized protein dnm_068710 [Desulfonema magnum]|uniref:Uncharacterized protein n=1 Tax=Desulfonema magnum TaxID=45655 RepID=A0A975GRB5_9BACT|nr:Uncharacterized protein dnm_068710 [Desulfonema magnum]